MEVASESFKKVMKVALDVSPLDQNSQHKVRGVGFYLERLRVSLETYCKDNVYIYFTDSKKPPLQADVVHYPYFEPFFLSLPKTFLKKTIVTVHDLTPLVFPDMFPSGIKGKLKWEIQKRLLRKVAAIITDSECSKNDIARLTGIPKEEIHVVYLAAGEDFKTLTLSEKDQSALRKKYSLPEKFALYVGDVTWNKNLPRLIDAVKKSEIPLVMVGKALTQKSNNLDNPWNNDLVAVQKQIANEKNISLLGFVPTDDLVMLYNMATVFVMPSLYEGFGLSVLEAMQSGCPVITSQEGSLAEVAGDSAYFVDAYDTDDIAHAIQKVYSDKALQEELRKKGFEQIKKFSWKKAAQETNKVYISV